MRRTLCLTLWLIALPVHARETSADASDAAAEQTYAKFEAAVAKRDAATAAKLFRKLPEESVYQEDAQASYDALRAEWVAARVEKAESFASARKCAKVKALVKEVARVFPEDKATIGAVACPKKYVYVRVQKDEQDRQEPMVMAAVESPSATAPAKKSAAAESTGIVACQRGDRSAVQLALVKATKSESTRILDECRRAGLDLDAPAQR